MFYCKSLLSMTVLSLFEGDLLGKVDKLYFDKKMKKLVFFELVGENGEKFLLPLKNIYRIGKNAIVVKNNQAVLLKTEMQECCLVPIGSKAYSIVGEFLGVVEELSLTSKFATHKVALDNGRLLDVNNMASCGRNTIIFNNESVKKEHNETRVEPQELKGGEIKAETLPVRNDKENKNASHLNSNFLIGRICIKDIFNFNNELLIKANTKVDKKNLKEISRYGKLKELMLYLK